MTTIKLRRGLSTAFSTNNPVLAAGEPAFATDTGILKIGDGNTAYNSLPSIGASPDLTNYVTTNTAQTISATKTFSANQNIGSIQIDCGSPTIRPTGTMTFRRDASSSSSDAVGIRFNAADNTNGGVACGVHSSSSYKGGLLLYTNDTNPYRYYPSIMFSPYGTPDSLNADITCYNNTALNVRATTVNIGTATSQSSGTYTGLRIAADGSLLEYNNNKVLDVSCVDGTTITYNSSTGKISSAGGAPTNMVTTDTQQTVTGIKSWSGQQFFNGGITTASGTTNRITGVLRFGSGSSNSYGGTLGMTGSYGCSLNLWTNSGNSSNGMTIDQLGSLNSAQNNELTVRRLVSSGTIDNGVFNVWSGNTEAASSTKFKVDNTGVTVNGSKVLTESTGVKSSDIRNIVKLTQSAYDALATKDSNTFYVIIPASS